MKLEKILSLENVSLDLDATTPDEKHKAKDLFCNKWDEARIALGLMEMIVKNPIAKFIIHIIMNVGDGIQDRVCPK